MIEVVRNDIKTLITPEELSEYKVINADCRMITFTSINFVGENMLDLIGIVEEVVCIFVNCYFVRCDFVNLNDNLNFFNCIFNGCKFETFGSYPRIFSSCSFNLMKVSHNGHDSWVRYLKSNFIDVTFEGFEDHSKIDADFYDCSYSNCSGPVPFTSRCPAEGSFIAYKKIACVDRTDRITKQFQCIAKLLIPEDALRLSAGGSKCRASKAAVLDILTLDGKPVNATLFKYLTFVSLYDTTFEYRKGSIVEPRNAFDPDRWNECSSGIHFFMTFEEAARY